jgi:hypothetical protein
MIVGVLHSPHVIRTTTRHASSPVITLSKDVP